MSGALAWRSEETGETLTLMEQGSERLQNGDPAAAFQCLEHAWRRAQELSEPPLWVGALGNLLVEACRALGKTDVIHRRALALYGAGVRDPVVVEIKARSCLAGGMRRDEEALEAFVTCIENHDGEDGGLRGEILSFLAAILEVDLDGDIAEAERMRPLLERLQEARPAAVFPAYQLGRYYYHKREFASARHHLDKVTGPLARTSRLLNLQARCAEKLGSHQTALDRYRRSLSADPNQADIHFCIGRLLMHTYLEA